MIAEKTWIEVGITDNFVDEMGSCIKHGDLQIALFNTNKKSEWYAVQNSCSHQNRMVLSRSIVGDAKGEPKIACPLHKHCFSLKTGEPLDEACHGKLDTYPVEIRQDKVFIQI